MLQDMVEQQGVEESKEEEPKGLSPPRVRPKRTRKRKAKPTEEAKEEVPEPQKVTQLERPHKSTWFLPGKVGRVPVQILVDTGCTTNLLSKKVFDKLDKATRETIEPHESYGIMASGAKMPFFGLIRTSLRIRHFATEEAFVVGKSDDHLVLGMSFLTKEGCSLDFRKGVLELQGKS